MKMQENHAIGPLLSLLLVLDVLVGTDSKSPVLELLGLLKKLLACDKETGFCIIGIGFVFLNREFVSGCMNGFLFPAELELKFVVLYALLF